MAKKEFPEWARVLYRGARTAAVTAFAQTVTLNVNWTNPQEAMKALVVSFGSGFLVAFGMWLRDQFGEKALVSKVMPI
jgi:hypothetical protein